MTPERKEEIKGYIHKLHNPEQYSIDEFHNAADIMDERKVEWTIELLAALEEAEQQREAYKEEYFRENEEKVRNGRLLAEAQQTIARQGEIIHGIDRDLTKLRMALASIANDKAGEVSVWSMMLANKAREALKEGETQP